MTIKLTKNMATVNTSIEIRLTTFTGFNQYFCFSLII